MLFAYGKLHIIFTQLYCPTKVSLCQARLNHSLFFLASIFPASLHSCTGSSCFESHKPKQINPHLTGYQAAAIHLGKLQSHCLGPAAATALINGPSWSSFAASLSTHTAASCTSQLSRLSYQSRFLPPSTACTWQESIFLQFHQLKWLATERHLGSTCL